MKKQLLIAAVAATMSVSAMADISISGSAKANSKNGVASIESDLKITGKSGDTTVVANIALDSGVDTGAQAGDMVEDLYLTTSFEGVNIKIGEYRSGASELDQTSGAATTRYNLSTSMGGVKVAFEETGSGSTNSVTVSGTVAGISASHKINSSSLTETKVSGAFGGVNLAYHLKEANATDDNTAISVSTTVGNVKLAYTTIDIEAALSGMDGAISDTTGTVNVGTHNAMTVSTAVAGNTITFKRYELNDVSNNKIIVKRGNLKATYNDNTDSLEVELAVKF